MLFNDLFDPLDQECLAGYKPRFSYRDLMFWHITNDFHARLVSRSAATGRQIETWFKSIKDCNDDSMVKASGYAARLSQIILTRTNILEIEMTSNGVPSLDPAWKTVRELKLLGIAASHFSKRSFDDASLAYYVSIRKGYDTLAAGFAQLTKEKVRLEALREKAKEEAPA